VIVKLLSYNIRFGGRKREKEIAGVIRSANPDIVVFQEATDTRVIDQLAAETGLSRSAARPEHSIGYISRLDIAHHEWHYPAGAKHSFLEIVLPGTEERIFGLHLSSTFSKWSERKRVREIQALLKSIERHQEGFHILVGDFNTLAPGELLDVRRMPAGTGLVPPRGERYAQGCAVAVGARPIYPATGAVAVEVEIWRRGG